jgi:zinc protease
MTHPSPSSPSTSLRRARLLALLLPAALACASRTAAPGAPPAPAPAPVATAESERPLPFDPKMRMGSLPNGLRYYLRRNREPEKRLTLRLVVDTGSVLERDDQQGLAHFVEHMAFNGTKLFKPRDIWDFMEKVGMRSGQHLNAETSFDQTIYTFEVPTDEAAVVRKGLQILQQIASDVAFDPAEVERERGVVLEEQRLYRGADDRLRRKLLPVLLDGSLYANRLPIGTLEVLRKASAEDLRAFYRRWYRPDLMAVVAIGDVDEAILEKEIRTLFEPLVRPAEPAARPEIPLPEHDQPRVVVFKDKELTETQVVVFQQMPRRRLASRADFRRWLVERLYHGMFNARLDELSRSAAPPFLGAGSGTESFVRTKGFFIEGAGVKQGEVAPALAALTRELQRVERFGFQASELQRLKAATIRGAERAVEEKDKTRSDKYAQDAIEHFLDGWITPSEEAWLVLSRELLATITVEEMNQAANQWISPRNRTILVSSPEAGAVPSPQELIALANKGEQDQLTPYRDNASAGPLVAKLPPPGPVVQTRTIAEVGVTEWRLRNGVRVVVKPTDFKNDQVRMLAFSPGGHSLVPQREYQSAMRGDAITSMGGLGQLDRTQLIKSLAGKAVGMQTYIDELEEGVRGSASPKDLETLLQLTHLSFTAPRRDQQAYDAYMAELREQAARRTADPNTVFWDRYQTIYFNNHPRRRPPDLKQLDEVSLDRALQAYKQRFADAGDFTFVFVGKTDPAQLQPLVERYLGSLPARKVGKGERWKDVGARPPSGVKRFEVRSGVDQKSTVSLEFTGRARWTRPDERLAWSVAEAFALRLRDVLREDLGATYNVSVTGSLFRRPYEGREAQIVSHLRARERAQVAGGGLPGDPRRPEEWLCARIRGQGQGHPPAGAGGESAHQRLLAGPAGEPLPLRQRPARDPAGEEVDRGDGRQGSAGGGADVLRRKAAAGRRAPTGGPRHGGREAASGQPLRWLSSSRGSGRGGAGDRGGSAPPHPPPQTAATSPRWGEVFGASPLGEGPARLRAR